MGDRASLLAVLATVPLGALNLTSCASRLPDKPVSAMSNTEVVIAFGQTARKSSIDTARHQEIDHEIQKRQLISAAEAIKVQDAKIYLGISSAAALASFGAPEMLGTSAQVPGVQLWRYPYDVENGGVLYVAGGKVIGYRIAHERDPQGRLEWSQAGQLYSQNFQARRCRQFADSHAVVTNCPDLDIGKIP